MSKPECMSLAFLKNITCNFSIKRRVGRGGFGDVYKGVLENGEEVAAKLISCTADLDDSQFDKEVAALFELRHENIVQLKGYCAESIKECVPWPEPTGREKRRVLAEKRERVLCLEYVGNGSLRRHISDASCGLEWQVRYDIIMGICSGLHYLHTNHNIAHMDLKPENILLDDNMVPKIADFGTSRLVDQNKSQIMTINPIGTLGYMAPEYQFDGSMSPKADIFSLGVIIVELMTGSRPPLGEESMAHVPNEVVEKWSNRLSNAAYSQQVRMCVSIAIECVNSKKDTRPTTGCIIKKLNEVQESITILLMHDALQRVLLDPNAEPIGLSLQLLKDITNNFSDDQRIGIDGSAVVYKGQLRNGAVAVKKLSQTLDKDEEEFQKEVASLMRVKHKNIIRFLGYCSETREEMPDNNRNNSILDKRERLLCFAFLPRGSLDKYITDATCGLDWHEIYDIICGICSGLHYLHTQCNIAHMDLKPEDILLDDNMVPKIDNFMDINGYMVPKYINGGFASQGEDIFSFGVIILELMTGSKLPECPLSEKYVAALPNEVVEKWRDRLSNAAYSQQVRMCVSIALKCVCSEKYRRPTTGCIIKMLDEVQDPNSLWYWVKTVTPDVAVGIVDVVLILVSPSSTWSWVVLTLKVVTVPITFSIGVVAIVLVHQQHHMRSWPRVILFAIGTALDAVLILLNPGSSWSRCLVLSLKVLTVLVALLAIGVLGLVTTHLIFVLPHPRRGSRMTIFTIGSIVAAVLVLLNPGSSWSWVVLTLKVLTALLTLHANGFRDLVATALILNFPNPRRWSGITLFQGSMLVAVLVLLNPSSSWSWVVLTLKILTALVTLLAIEVSGLVATPLILNIPTRIWFTLAAVLLLILNPSRSWSWVVLAMKVLAALVTLPLVGFGCLIATVVIINVTAVIINLLNPRRWSLAKGSILAAVLLLILNPSRSCSWMVLALKVLSAPVIILPLIGPVSLMATVFIVNNLMNPRRWSRMTLFATGPILAAVLVLLKTRSSWSWWVVTTPNVVNTPTLLFALGVVYGADEDLHDLRSSSRLRVILCAIKAVLATVLGLLNPSLSWSAMVKSLRTLKVIMTPVALNIAVGCATVFLIYWLLVPKKSSWKWVILFAIGVLMLLNPSSIRSCVEVSITAPFTYYAIGVTSSLLWGGPLSKWVHFNLICTMMLLVTVSSIFASGVLSAVVMFSREILAVILFFWRHTAAALLPRINPIKIMNHV